MNMFDNMDGVFDSPDNGEMEEIKEQPEHGLYFDETETTKDLGDITSNGLCNEESWSMPEHANGDDDPHDMDDSHRGKRSISFCGTGKCTHHGCGCLHWVADSASSLCRCGHPFSEH